LGEVLGGGLFFLLKFHPTFSQLFGRGGDFLFSVSELISGGYHQVLSSQSGYLSALILYMTPLGLSLPVIGLFNHRRRLHTWLILMSLSFILPIAILGKVVYPRYFLPALIPLTVSASLALAEFIQFVLKQVSLKRRLLWSAGLTLVIVNLVGPSLQFISYA